MYSKELQEVFSRLGIKVGDTILIRSDSDSQQGILMPRTEAGGSDIIVIKRKDGYNIGIKYVKSMGIEKVSEGASHHFSFPKKEPRPNPSLGKMTMIYTGGTIGSKVDYVSGGVYMLTRPEELLHDVPELDQIANIEINELMSVASEDMSYAAWIKIAEAAAKALNNGAKGVVITHGTDTMHYTSAALSFMLKNLNAPVVMTGSQRSSDRGSSDAFMNLICSAQIAMKSDVAEVGICMHGSSSDNANILLRGTKARKMHTSRRDAFRPINNLPICSVDQKGKITYLSDYRKVSEDRREKVSAQIGYEPKVALVKAYPNSDPEIIEYYLSKGYKGLIIEGTGLGHVPSQTEKKGYSWLSSVKTATDSGMIIGATSQCLYGRVSGTVYRNLRLLEDAGAIHCEDMLPEVAYVKLGFLLGNYGKEKASEMLNKDIAGEITQRTEFDFPTE